MSGRLANAAHTGVRRTLWLPAAMCLVQLISTAIAADPPAANPAQEFFRRFQQQPFGDPQEMFDRLSGTDSEELQAALEQVEVSPEEERRFGNRAAEAFLDDLRRQRIRTTTQGREVNYLRKLVDAVRPQMQHAERYEEVRIILARSPLTDARSFPGGTLVFFEGMLDFADSEAALVGVIGHELSHLDRGHQLVQMKAMKLSEDNSAGGNGSFMRSGPLLMQVWSRPFRPEDERQADLDGADWVYRAGYDPREMAKLFLRLHERNEQQLDPGDFVPGFLRAHPYERDRYEAVMQRYDELQRTDPAESLYVGRENLRRRMPRSQQEFDENS